MSILLSKIHGFVNFVQAWIQQPASLPSPPPRSPWSLLRTCAPPGLILNLEFTGNKNKLKDNQWNTLVICSNISFVPNKSSNA